MVRRFLMLTLCGVAVTNGLIANGAGGSPRHAHAGAAPARVVAARPTATTAATKHSRWVMGYYAIYERRMMPAKEIDWSGMTHLVVGAVVPRSDGTLDTSFYDTPSQGPKIAKQLAKKAKSHGVKPILMIGGAGVHDQFAAAATHHRAALVKHLLATMKTYGYQGLDLDWEPVQDNSEGKTLVKLAGALRKKAPHAILTMPVLWVTKNFPHVPFFYSKLAKPLDRIDVMTYGMAGAYDGWRTWHSSALKGAGSSTPSDIAVNVKSYEKAGVPARKLGIGVGFYGTCWAGGVTGPRQDIGASYIAADDDTMSYTTIMSDYYSSHAYHYDTKADAPYLSFGTPHGAQNCTFVSYENPRSVAAKGAYAEKHGLGAEIIWTINQGHVKGAKGGKTDPLLLDVRKSFH